MYYLGLIRGTGRCQCWGNGHKEDTLVLQARRDKGYLSCDLWKYLGQRVVTKAHLKRHKVEGGIIPAGVNLSRMCRERGLDKGHMGDVKNGKRPHHKGWTLLVEKRGLDR